MTRRLVVRRRITVLADLVPLDAAKRHLRIVDDLHDQDVQQKLDLATAVIGDYLADWQPVDEWTTDTIPLMATAAILMMLTHLYEHRGDDMAPTASGATPDADVWAAIERVCARLRAPTVR